MSNHTTNTSGKSATRWWRLDPLVAAHLRSTARPDNPVESHDETGTTLARRWTPEPQAWADTDWSETQVDFFLD